MKTQKVYNKCWFGKMAVGEVFARITDHVWVVPVTLWYGLTQKAGKVMLDTEGRQLLAWRFDDESWQKWAIADDAIDTIQVTLQEKDEYGHTYAISKMRYQWILEYTGDLEDDEYFSTLLQAIKAAGRNFEKYKVTVQGYD